MSPSSPSSRVDSEALVRAHTATLRTGEAFDDVRRQVHQIRAGVPDWAGDPLLADAVTVLLGDLDAAGLRGQADTAELAAALVTAARDFSEVESAATYPG